MTDHSELVSTARTVLTDNLGVETGESFLVVTDTERSAIGRAFFEAGVSLDLDAGVIETEPLERSGMEPPDYVAAAMERADVVVCPTTASLTHTRAREQACERGARVATMPGITAAMFSEGAMTADYTAVESLTADVAERLTNAETARIENGGETLTIPLGDRAGIASDGIIRNSGESGNLPSGEGYIAPQEDAAYGTLVVDGGIAGVGRTEDSLVLEIEDGTITDMEGEPTSSFVDTIGEEPCARRVAELGIGTNPAARIIGNVLEDEKVYGTCHVAFGDNRGFGGTIDCPSHVDVILDEPDLYLDDELLVSGGDVHV